MITMKDAIAIKVTPERIEEWLLDIDKHYQEWHPEHVKWVNLDGSLEEGSTFYFEEYLDGRLIKSKCRITRLERNDKTTMEFRGLSIHERLLGVRGSLLVEPTGDGCMVTATISLRFGWLVSRVFKKMGQAIQKHMKEEGENLKRILES